MRISYLLIVLLTIFPDSFSKAQELKVDVDFHGDDGLQIYSPDVQHCQLACTQHHSCSFFTFLRSDWSKDNRAFHCYLKHTATGVPSQVLALQGVTSGFKLTEQDNKTDVCLPSTYEDVDFTGSEYRHLILNSSEDCQKQCTRDPDCKFFSFTTETFPDVEMRKKCHLKFRWTVPIPSDLKKTPGLVSGFSDSLFKEECKERIFANIHYRGNDIESVPAVSPQHCLFLCSTHPRCTHFTYTTSEYSTNYEINMHCFLKYTNDVNKLVSVREEELYSGFATRNCKPSHDWATTNYEGLHFFGHDYRDFKADTPEICKETCRKDPACHFYTYVLPSYRDKAIRKKCLLKSRWTVSTPSVVIKTPGLTSGFSASSYKSEDFEEECKEEIFANIHYRGKDFENVPAVSPQHCLFLCSTHPRCTHFTYTTSEYSTDPKINMHCFLKHTDNVNELVSEREEELYSGFPTRNCTSSNVWATTLYDGLDFYGHDYRAFKTNTLEICREICTKDPDCHFYTYVHDTYHNESIRKKCHLKFRWSVPAPSVLIKTLGVVSESKEEIFANIHYRGNDIENVPAVSPQHCLFLCSTHPRCTHFTYTTSEYSTDPKINMHCFLKHTQAVSRLVSIKEEELFSGFPTRNCKHSNVWASEPYEGLHFYGHDYRDFKTDMFEICKDICTKDTGCHFYTYVLPSYHDESIRQGCYLKRVMTLPRPEKVVHRHGVISGFSLRNC